MLVLRKRMLWVLVASIVLVGCSHDLTLVGRDQGQQGTGYATGVQSGSITMNLNNKTYTGNWVAASGAYSGQGSALLRAEDGSRLRCEFKADHFLGFGTCEDDKKRIYDLQIH